MEFLRAIAKAFTDRHEDLHSFLFVFPNKRSCKFFRKYVEDFGTAKEKLPKTIAVTDFVAFLSGRKPATKTELVFMLYDEYRKTVKKAIDFEKFRGWADTVISDFSDVDMYGVDADMLFKNVADYNEIQTDYLTAEQRRMMKEYFGYTSEPEKSTQTFWEHYNPAEDKNNSSHKRRFMQLWQLLAPLYHALNKRLAHEGKSYSGMAYKLACQRLEEEGKSVLPYSRIVFVGFNVLPSLQYKMFDILFRVADADFYWDCTGPALADEENTATYFVHRNMKKFRSKYDISASDVNSFPEVMEVIASPSNSVQAKLAGEIVTDLWSNDIITDRNLDKTAIVLPDEKLLVPLLYSLPHSIKDRNMTMGMPLRLSLSASLVGLIKRMYKRGRHYSDKTKVSFFYEDVTGLLGHSLLRLLAADAEIKNVVSNISEQRMFMVDSDWLSEQIPALSHLFIPMTKEAEVKTAREYLAGVLDSIAEILKQKDSNTARSELVNIEEIDNMADKIAEMVERYDMKLNADAFFRMIDKEINLSSISIEGEPLNGLQIMGTLETRCLDFENIIIPSLNERIFPQRMQLRSFIPNNLRRGFGMPTTWFRECVFAYYFYRMISRSKRVYLIYDARTSGLKSGDPSRYLLQLKHLYPDCGLKWEYRTFRVHRSEAPTLFVAKNERVTAELDKFKLRENGKNLSVSAITTYMNCPLKFYFQYVHNIKEILPPEEFLSAINFGNIFHKVMEYIYTPENQNIPLTKGHLITPEVIDKFLNNPATIDAIVSKMVMRELKSAAREPLPEHKFYAGLISRNVRKTLQADRELATMGGGFTYIGSEVKGSVRYCYAPGKRVNLKYVIDRIDAPGCTPDTIRLSDYKTGADNYKIDNPADSLKEEKKAHVVFQLFVYAKLLQLTYPQLTDNKKISLAVYQVSRQSLSVSESYVQVNKQPILDVKDYENSFSDILNDLIGKIMSPDVDFEQAAPGSRCCIYCPYSKICGR